MVEKRLINEVLTKENLHIRPCTTQDLNDVMNLQKRILDGMEEKEWFAKTSRTENEKFFQKPNLLLGIYAEERLIAYGSMGFLEKDQENLGWDLGWPEEKVRNCTNLDTIVVDPAFRGKGLQRLLISLCIEQARKVKPGGTLLTTICPDNRYSMRNAEKEGFEILLRTKKYGGKDRYILGKAL